MAQIKDLKRMCAFYEDCTECGLYKAFETCGVCFLPDSLDEIVDKWVNEHPVKTYAMDFFEKFPNAVKDSDGLPRFCVEEIYGVKNDNCGYDDCSVCIDCWNREVQENEF